METTVKQRLVNFMESQGISQYRFEKTANLSNGYIDKLRNAPSIDKLSNILDAFPELNRTWLLTGEGEMLNTPTPTEEQEEETDPQPLATISYDENKGKPYYNVDFLGGFGELAPDTVSIPQFYIDCAPYNKPGVVWCNLTGDSMEPLIPKGCMIAVQEILNWQEGLLMGEVYALVTVNDMRTVKTIKAGSTPDTLRLVPYNKEYEEQEIPIKSIYKVFKVLGYTAHL